MNEANIPEIRETGEEKKLSAGDLKKKYLAIAQSRFIGNPPVVVINGETNRHIELSWRVISEWRAKSRTRERLLSVQLLDRMIEGASFLKTTEDSKGTAGIGSVSYFENHCLINGKRFRINITTKKQKFNGREFAYYYSATGPVYKNSHYPMGTMR